VDEVAAMLVTSVAFLIALFIYQYWAGSSADLPRKKKLQQFAWK